MNPCLAWALTCLEKNKPTKNNKILIYLLEHIVKILLNLTIIKISATSGYISFFDSRWICINNFLDIKSEHLHWDVCKILGLIKVAKQIFEFYRTTHKIETRHWEDARTIDRISSTNNFCFWKSNCKDTYMHWKHVQHWIMGNGKFGKNHWSRDTVYFISSAIHTTHDAFPSSQKLNLKLCQ